MEKLTATVNNIDQHLSEVDNLLHALRFIAETIEEPQMAEMRDSAVTMLYVMKDKMQLANRELAALNRIAIAAA
jgi:hypothetical protein